MDVWDKQNEETGKAYNAFLTYRDMGALRSLRKAAKLFYGIDDIGESSGKVRQFNKWSSKYNWVTRCEAWDVEEERQRIAEKRSLIRKMDERQASYGESLQKIGIINIHAHAGLNVKDKAGKAIETTIPVEESRKLFETGVKTERIARGGVTEISERKHIGAIDIREVEIREQARDD